MSEIKIASASDLDGINQLIKAVHSDTCSAYKPPFPMNLEDIIHCEDSVTFVSKNNELILGYLRLHSDRSFQDCKNSAEFEMCVHPDHRNQNEATYLFEHTHQYVINKTNLYRIELKLSKDSTKAKKLYKKLGFCTNVESEKGEIMFRDIKR